MNDMILEAAVKMTEKYADENAKLKNLLAFARDEIETQLESDAFTNRARMVQWVSYVNEILNK